MTPAVANFDNCLHVCTSLIVCGETLGLVGRMCSKINARQCLPEALQSGWDYCCINYAACCACTVQGGAHKPLQTAAKYLAKQDQEISVGLSCCNLRGQESCGCLPCLVHMHGPRYTQPLPLYITIIPPRGNRIHCCVMPPLARAGCGGGAGDAP